MGSGPEPRQRLMRFGVLEADLTNRELRKRGKQVHLQDQPFRVLEALLEKPGEIVTREELKDRLWAQDEFVEFDKSLTTAVQKIRDALGDSASSPRFVETVPRQGYKFIAPIHAADFADADRETAARKRRRTIVRVAAALTAGLVIAAWMFYEHGAPAVPPANEARPVHFGIPPPPGSQYQLLFRGGASAISPDGAYVAFVTTRANGETALWIHDLSTGAAKQLAGTGGARFPFWSPDSRNVAFFAAGTLKRVPRAAGLVQELCDAPGAHSGAWAPDGASDGIIVFGNGLQALQRVPASGGDAQAATRLDAAADEIVHRHPSFLPDGRRFLYVAATQSNKTMLRLASLHGPAETEAPVVPLDTDSKVEYAVGDDGLDYLVYAKGTTLFAQPVDRASLQLVGPPKPFLDGIETYNQAKRRNFSLSKTGVLLYRQAGGGSTQPLTQLTWFDRSGVELGKVGEPALLFALSLSPDDSRVVAGISDAETFLISLWICHVERGGWERFTTAPALDKVPVWSPDGSAVAFGRTPRASMQHGTDIYTKAVSGAANESLALADGHNNFPMSWTPEGGKVIYATSRDQTLGDIWETTLQQPREQSPVIATRFKERAGKVSPAGEWIAYTSDRTGVGEVYIARYPSGGDRILVSTGGGIYPVWRGDGKELYYIRPDNTMMAVAIDSPTPNHPPIAEELFRTNLPAIFAETAYPYDVSAHGDRFLIKVEPKPRPLRVILNWNALIKQ